MDVEQLDPPLPGWAGDKHFSCSLSAVVVARVYEHGGTGAVEELLRRAGSERDPAELADLANWISYAEAHALFSAGADVTHHPAFARSVGEDTARRLNGSPLATMLRSLGSPEHVYRHIAITAAKYSTVLTMEAVHCEPGRAELIARPVEPFPRSVHHCEWTIGLLSTATLLFGLPPAVVEHSSCAAYGACACHYHVRWPAEDARRRSQSSEEVDKLREQLEAMKERLHSMFQTAADLISSGDVDDVLGRIAKRAALEIRAPRHLLAVRMTPDGPLHCHQDGFPAADVPAVAERLLSEHPSELPANWLAVPIRSTRRDYGSLLAAYPHEVRFFPQERELLEVYARYAASALDSASGLLEAQSRYGQSSALLELARSLAVAGTSAEVAQRLADSVPVVVDCDQVAVFVSDGAHLVRQAVWTADGVEPLGDGFTTWAPAPGSALASLLRDPRPEPRFYAASDDSPQGATLREFGYAATILVPLVSGGSLLGMLTVAVRERPSRLRSTPDLLDRLSGVGAQAATALQNGRLVDLITYQALHDQLTGLANRVQFTTDLRDAIGRAQVSGEVACLLYLDLDRFKPVNDELGHEAGDELLVAVARRLRECTRAADTVARLGGDEFAVLVSAATADELDVAAQRITGAFLAPFRVAGESLPLGVSLGRAVFPADAADADGLLRYADEAMFAHKRSRRTAARVI